MNRINKIIIILIIVIIFTNFAFSYRAFDQALYDDQFSGDLFKEISSILAQNEKQQRGFEYKEIGELLAKDPDIKNKYIMSDVITYSYYSGAKFIDAEYHEGIFGDNLNNYVERNNWSDFDIYFSNLYSYPQDRNNLLDRIPDYLIINPYHSPQLFEWNKNSTQFKDIMTLTNPLNENIPNNFEFIYKSNKTGVVVYKINHG